MPHCIEYRKAAAELVAGGVNSNVRLSGVPIPLCFQDGHGSNLRDLDGNEYIDYAAGMGPAILGHSSHVLSDVLIRAVSECQLYAGQSELELELAKRLCRILDFAELIRIGMTGSEMVQIAMRLSRAHTGRRKIIKFEGHYHGWYDNILVNVGSKSLEKNRDGSIIVQLETAGQSESVKEDLVVLPWNDADVLREFFINHGESIAGMIMEPVMCNSGVIAPREGFLEEARELCDKFGVVLIFDEVITGFRVDIAGARGRFGVAPDLATYAKALGGGFPIAAIAGRKAIMEHVGSGEVNHSGTYNANVLSLSAAIATLDELERDDAKVLRDIESSGQRLIEGMHEIAKSSRLPLHVQGYGSVFYTYFSDRAPVSNFGELADCDKVLLRRFIEGLHEEGVRPTSRGTWFVTASHSEQDVERTLHAVSQAIRRL